MLVEMNLGLGMDLSPYYGHRKMAGGEGAPAPGAPMIPSSETYSSDLEPTEEESMTPTRSLIRHR